MSWAGPLHGRDGEGVKSSAWRVANKRGRALLGSCAERSRPEPHPPLRLEKWFALVGSGEGQGAVLSEAEEEVLSRTGSPLH